MVVCRQTMDRCCSRLIDGGDEYFSFLSAAEAGRKEGELQGGERQP